MILVVTPVHASTNRGQLFDAAVDGRTVVTRSTQPLLDAARVLLAEGVDPDIWIVMRHAGRADDALRSTVGAAAALSVAEGERAPRFISWKASPHATGASPVSLSEVALAS